MNKAVIYISGTTNETVNNMIVEVLERYCEKHEYEIVALLGENSQAGMSMPMKYSFIGMAEVEDIDAVVTDGFTGNIFLKTVEGFGKLVKRSLTESLKKNLLSTIGAIPALPSIKRFSKTMDYKEYGGALFLGVKKPVVKAHGSSDDYLFYFTIKQAEKFAESKAVEILKEEFEKMK